MSHASLNPRTFSVVKIKNVFVQKNSLENSTSGNPLLVVILSERHCNFVSVIKSSR